MKTVVLLFALLVTVIGYSQETTSKKVFDNVTLVNKVEFFNANYDQDKIGCAFLLKYGKDTFAVTAKHIVKIIRPESMNSLSFENFIRSWTLFSLNDKSQMVICDTLLNENKSLSLDDKSIYEDDWLIFSIKQNSSQVKPLVIRTTPLVEGEKLYVAGWTRTMENGPQRVYEFDYYKTIGNRILLKDVIVPEKFGGLSGAPLLDENGLVVGLVSNGTPDPVTNKKYFSPCAITSLLAFLKSIKD